MSTHTTQADMTSIFGEDAILNRLDDDATDAIEGNESTWLSDSIQEASDEIDMRLQRRYDPAVITSSPFIQRCAAYLAVHHLSKRRGNPSQYVEDYERYIALLDDIKAGKYDIPGVDDRYDNRPRMSNLVVDHNFHKAKIRVEQETSEGDTYGDQHLDWEGPYD